MFPGFQIPGNTHLTSVTRVFLLTLGSNKFLGFNGFYYDNFVPSKKTIIKLLMLQPKNAQNVRHHRSTKVGMKIESFQKEPSTQRHGPRENTEVQMQLPKHQIKEDKSISVVPLVFIVQLWRYGGWTSSQGPVRCSCGALGAISCKRAWILCGPARSPLWRVHPLPSRSLLEVDSPLWFPCGCLVD